MYRSRPPSAQEVIRACNNYARLPPVVYLSDVSPSTTVFSVTHANLLLVCLNGSEVDPLGVLEFLYRVCDVFEEFLGTPLQASKIEDSYEVVAQLLNEICDNGVVCNTETNSLRESVEVSNIIGKLFSQVGLHGSSPAVGSSSTLASGLKPQPALNSGPAIPWRRPNVRHTSNELYVDMVETLSVILAPSGRPIAARAAGSIAFTAKISGVPDLILTLSAPGGTSAPKSAGISRTMQLPTFHPCVRLNRWKENPGELSFIPPDGRFMLAGYEVDLLPSPINTDHPPSKQERLFLPASVDLRTSLGPTSSDFEARLTLNTNFPGVISQPKPSSLPGRNLPTNPFSFGSASSSGSSNQPTLESVSVTIPFPPQVRAVTELKPSRGEASFNTWTKTVEWKIPTKDGASVAGVATLTGTVLGPVSTTTTENDTAVEPSAQSANLLGYYDEDSAPAVVTEHQTNGNGTTTTNSATLATKSKTAAGIVANKALMPRTALASFTVRGWLSSGIRVESLMVDVKKSKGLGEGVKPFKGVKYITVSKEGVERRGS